MATPLHFDVRFSNSWQTCLRKRILNVPSLPQLKWVDPHPYGPLAGKLGHCTERQVFVKCGWWWQTLGEEGGGKGVADSIKQTSSDQVEIVYSIMCCFTNILEFLCGVVYVVLIQASKESQQFWDKLTSAYLHCRVCDRPYFCFWEAIIFVQKTWNNENNEIWNYLTTD